jgi:hypothetical protein
MGISGGFEQEKPAKALLELKVFNDKYKGQSIITQTRHFAWGTIE